MFTVKGNFICIFKTGDNIAYNLKILSALYEQFNNADSATKLLLSKPIILLIASITEAILHDFHLRMRLNTVEGVKNIAKGVLDYIRGKQIDEFETYIASARKHDLFDAKNTDFYEKLDELRKLRNRIHIQNVQGQLEPDDRNAFTLARKELAEQILEMVMKTMSDKYPRPERIAQHMSEFTVPWNEHFPDESDPRDGYTPEELALLGLQ